ncbi:MAG: hypothetical protein JKY54_12150 [Flavobacteriales bacterium]|nr:hypothetical protein [Flavobacteriales bacterium]
MARIVGGIAFNNLILFNVLSIVEILTFSWLYYTMINQKRWVWLLGAAAIAYVFVETLGIDADEVASFQSYSKMVSSFAIVIMGLKYILEHVKEERSILNRNLNYVIIFYFSLELILLLPLNFLINQDSNLIFYIWFLHLGINILLYVYLIRFIWKNGKIQKQLRSGL